MSSTSEITPAQLTAAADAYEGLARNLKQYGLSALSSYGHIAAAEIDLLNPALKASYGHPFNGQLRRCETVLQIVERCSITDVVEIGTQRGATSEFLADQIRGNLYTCEIEPRFFLYSQKRLSRCRNVEVILNDSRAFLNNLFLSQRLKGNVLFYLDAHWREDLPLLEEVKSILDRYPSSVIVINDFEVPFDSGYGYDYYGPGKKVCLELLNGFRSQVSNFYFPMTRASEETGVPRGYVVFSSDRELDLILSEVTGLRKTELAPATRPNQCASAVLRSAVEGDVDLVVQQAFFTDRAYQGTMVEVGAAKPDYLSVSASFRSLGWRVISIEPNPYFCELYRRQGLPIVECACGDSDKDDVSFFVVETHGIYHGQRVSNESFSSLGVRGKYADLMQSVSASQKEIKVNVRRLDTVLRENAPDLSAIDVVCIDVEGWELEVLNGLSFDVYKPKVLIIENLFTERSYVDYMAHKGYALWKRIEPNDIFVRSDVIEQITSDQQH